MQADYLDAHERHLDDADRLFKSQRWANSDYLYGMAAECGLKRLMLAFGMPVDPTTGNPTQRQDWRHADIVWMRYESYRCGHHQGAGYSLSSTNPFANWDVAQRYAHQSNFDQTRAQAHQNGSNLVRALVQKAKREGLLC